MFAPERAGIRKEVLYSLAGTAVLGPVLLWWKDVAWQWWAPCLVGAFAIAAGQDVYKARVRGRDFVYVVAEGIRVTNRRRVWLMRWQDIHRVHRFKETIVFESADLRRRETLSLEGHDHHLRAMIDAIEARARTLNLGWLQSLADLLG